MAVARRRRVVVLGAGFAGAYCARTLERRLRKRRHDLGDVEVVVLNRDNYFLFTPLLVEASTGSVEPRHAVIAIRRFIRSRRSRFIMAEVLDVDVERAEVTYRVASRDEPETLSYDHLVVALGAVPMVPPVPGLKEHAHAIKSLGDGVALRDHMIRMLELADLTEAPELRREILHLVVVGANYTGVEVAGEFHAFLLRAQRQYERVRPEDVRVTLVEMKPRILPILDEELAAFATERMRRRGIDIRLEATAGEVGPDRIALSGGEELRTRTVIWCAGLAPPSLVGRTGLSTDDRGYVACEPTMQVRGHANVWAIGDCAVNPRPGGDGGPYPPTAQHATRLGRALAENLCRALAGERPEPARLKDLGALVPLGGHLGVARVLGLKLSGRLAWFLYRTFYLLKMPGIARSVRVALDWTMDLLLPPDHVQLGLRSPPLDRSAPETARRPERQVGAPHTRESAPGRSGQAGRSAERPG